MIKAKPQVKENQAARICPKCSGTGLFATMTIDGRAYSPTGTTCWTCNGKGWVIRSKRGSRKSVTPANQKFMEWSLNYGKEYHCNFKTPAPCPTCGETHPNDWRRIG